MIPNATEIYKIVACANKDARKLTLAHIVCTWQTALHVKSYMPTPCAMYTPSAHSYKSIRE